MAGPGVRETPPGPHIDPETGDVRFFVPDGTDGTPVRVWFHLREFGADPRFVPVDGGWLARIPPPPVDRLEYLLVMRDEHGAEQLTLDPAAPGRVAGVFGDHSVLIWPDYRVPEWAGTAAAAWDRLEVEVAGRLPITGALHSPAGTSPDEPLPLVVAHDGPEYARLAGLLDYLGWVAGRTPPLRARVLLLQPHERNTQYAASRSYAGLFTRRLLPAVRRHVAVRGPLVGVGASLGALALTHVQASHPGTFGGLFLQSGSFFLPEYDAHESGFERYRQVVAFVRSLREDPVSLTGTRVALTAGTGEDNLDNNRALARLLRERGVPVTMTEGRDGHNYTAWRDLLHPALEDLLLASWSSTDRRD